MDTFVTTLKNGLSGFDKFLNNPISIKVIFYIMLLASFYSLYRLILRPIFGGEEKNLKEKNIIAFTISFISTTGFYLLLGRNFEGFMSTIGMTIFSVVIVLFFIVGSFKLATNVDKHFAELYKGSDPAEKERYKKLGRKLGIAVVLISLFLSSLFLVNSLSLGLKNNCSFSAGGSSSSPAIAERIVSCNNNFFTFFKPIYNFTYFFLIFLKPILFIFLIYLLFFDFTFFIFTDAKSKIKGVKSDCTKDPNVISSINILNDYLKKIKEQFILFTITSDINDFINLWGRIEDNYNNANNFYDKLENTHNCDINQIKSNLESYYVTMFNLVFINRKVDDFKNEINSSSPNLPKLQKLINNIKNELKK